MPMAPNSFGNRNWWLYLCINGINKHLRDFIIIYSWNHDNFIQEKVVKGVNQKVLDAINIVLYFKNTNE